VTIIEALAGATLWDAALSSVPQSTDGDAMADEAAMADNAGPLRG